MKKYIALLIIAAVIQAPVNAQFSITGTAKTGNHGLPSSFKYTIFSDTALSKAAYLKKSKTQKTIGWALLGGGVTMVVVGGGLFVNNFELFSRDNDDAAGAGAVLFLCGAGCTLGSIPFFISAAHNSKNAARISMGGREIVIPQQNSFTVKMQPAVSLTVQF